MKISKKWKRFFVIIFCLIQIGGKCVTVLAAYTWDGTGQPAASQQGSGKKALSSVTRRDYNADGLSLGEYLDVTYHKVLKYLDIALDKDRYLGEPYYLTWKLDEEGMNCEGFIYAHLCNAFADKDKVHSMIGARETCEGWNSVVAAHNIKYSTYTGDDWEELCDYIVNDGLIQPGDVIWMWNGPADDYDGLAHTLSDYHHIAFYVGDYFDDKNVNDPYWQGLSGADSRLRIWHSTGDTPPEMDVKSGNVTTRMYGMAHDMPCSISVFPINNGARGLKIIKNSTQPKGTDSSDTYPLEGARYSIFSDFNLTREADRLVTDADGTAFSHSLRPGTYYVKETEAPPGYTLDAKTYSFIISADSRGFVELKLTDEPIIDEDGSEDMSIGAIDIFESESFMRFFTGGGVGFDSGKVFDISGNGGTGILGLIDFKQIFGACKEK